MPQPEIKQHLAYFALLVRDYDEALDYYCGALGFQLLEDTDMGAGKRWLRVAPPGSGETSILLAKAAKPEQFSAVGRQSGGRVFLFLHSNDFWRDYRRYQQAGVEFTESPRQEVYGTVVVFKDLYGNKWDLIEPRTESD